MAYIQYIQLLLLFLAFPAYLEIQCAEGRQLKAMNEHDLGPAKIETGMVNHAKQAVDVAQSLGNHKDSLQVVGQKKILPPMTPTQSHGFSSSDVSRQDTFQLTAPGSYRGVGYSFVGQKHKMQPNVQGFTSVAGQIDGFKATTQGHSPGIGHSFRDSKAGPNA